MRKEIIFAILVGSSLGVAVAFGIWRVNLFFRDTSETPSQTNPTPAPSNNNSSLDLDIISPVNYSISGESEIIINGVTNQNALIALASEDQALIITADSQGKFETKIELLSGINEMVITAFDENGKSINKKLTIIYSTLFSNGDNATALLGTITDLSESTIQIRSESGEIEQVSISEETNYANILKTSKEIEFSDLAIGDYIVALGTTNGNKVLESKRILVTTAMSGSTIRTVFGEVATFSNQEFVIKDIAGNEWSIDAKGGIEVIPTKLSDLKENDKIIVVGNFDKEELDADLIYIIP